ncbi:hypothetical protein [Nonomuraea africana]|uniref:hypothetical protein n=1 Tax=Nonomuraea africana TaxID=46171 RepID=UPI00340FD05E
MGLGRYSGRLARVTLLAAATGTLAAGALPQDQAGRDEEYVYMTPNPAKPGSQVAITTNACLKSTNVSAVSRAFPGYSVFLSLKNGRMHGSTTLPRSLYPSQYAVAVRCANEEATGYFRVIQHARHPTFGPHTGGGGLALGSDPAERAGSESSRAPWLAGAIAVLVTVAGTGAILVRRRRRPGRDGAP